jgi:hypothetical protein
MRTVIELVICVIATPFAINALINGTVSSLFGDASNAHKKGRS